MRKVFNASRYLIYLPILGSLLASFILMVYGLAEIVRLLIVLIPAGLPEAEEIKYLAADITKLIDLFLLGAVLYIIAIGLDELFIDPDLPTPPWLTIHSLDDLKERLLATVVVLLVVYFLGYYAEWQGGIDILWAGLAVAAVLAPIVYLLVKERQHHEPPTSAPPEDEQG